MKTIDLRKELKSYYSPSTKKIELVELPRFNFLMIDGKIERGHSPNTSAGLQENIGALFGLAYTLKFMLKKQKVDPVDYPVMAMEGLWWVEDGHFDINIKDNWLYTMMILIPEVVSEKNFEEGIMQLQKKKGDKPAFSRLRLESFCEGLSVQTLHMGPYANEPATVARMDAFAAENGLIKHGKHHEIYMGNPILADPSKLKTILRHPVKKPAST